MSKPASRQSPLYTNSKRPAISPLDVAGCCPTCGGPKVVSKQRLPSGREVLRTSCLVCQHCDDLHNLAHVSPSEGMQSEVGWQVYLFLIFLLLSGIALFTVLLPWLEGGR